MASTTCKVCGKSISATAKDCPCFVLMPTIVKLEIAMLVLVFIAIMIIIKQTPTIEQPVAKQVRPSVEALYDIPKIAGKTEAEVEALLGEPVFCAKSEAALNCSFQENEIEIVFIDGKADWITVYGAYRSPAYRLKIEGRSKAEALKLLGDPVYCVKAKSVLHCGFREGNVSVEFIDGKVDEITVKGYLGRAAFSKETLALLGLPVNDAAFSNKNVMRWENIAGFLSVTLRSAGNDVAFATVKVKTK